MSSKKSRSVRPVTPISDPPATSKPKERFGNKALLKLFEPLVSDLRYPISYLYIWYESFQKIMRWIGAIAAGMLTFTATFLLKDLVTPGSGGGIQVRGNPATIASQLVFVDARNLQFALLFLASALIAVLLNLLVTYNWMVAGLKASMQQLAPAMQRDGLLDETLGRELRSYGALLSMRTWGMISFTLGGVAGVLLLLGIGTYVAATWGLVRALT